MNRCRKVCTSCPERVLVASYENTRSKKQEEWYSCHAPPPQRPSAESPDGRACYPMRYWGSMPVPKECQRWLEHTVLGKNNQQDDDRGSSD